MSDNVKAARGGENEYDFDFRDWPFYWIARVDRKYHNVLERVLAHISLDIPSWRVLMILHSKSSASVSEIADHAIVKLSTMTKIIQRMEADELVASGPSELDRRVTMVTITAKGEQTGRQAWIESAKIKDRVFADLSTNDRDTLVRLLRHLSDELKRF